MTDLPFVSLLRHSRNHDHSQDLAVCQQTLLGCLHSFALHPSSPDHLAVALPLVADRRPPLRTQIHHILQSVRHSLQLYQPFSQHVSWQDSQGLVEVEAAWEGRGDEWRRRTQYRRMDSLRRRIGSNYRGRSRRRCCLRRSHSSIHFRKSRHLGDCGMDQVGETWRLARMDDSKARPRYMVLWSTFAGELLETVGIAL